MSINQFKYHFNIGVVGYLEHDISYSTAFNEISQVLNQIEFYVKKCEDDCFGVNPISDVSFDFYTCPLFTDSFIVDFYEQWKHGKLCTVMPDRCGDSTDISKFSRQDIVKTTISDLNIKKSGLNTLINYVVNESDIALVLWSGTESDNSGNARNFINQCSANKIPCIWLNIKENASEAHWFESGFPESYSDERVKYYIEGLYPNKSDSAGGIDLKNPFLFPYQDSVKNGKIISMPAREDFKPQRFPLYKLINRATKSFEKRYDVLPKYNKNKELDFLTEYEKSRKELENNKYESNLLDDTYQLEIDANEKEKDVLRENHSVFRECFKYYTVAGDLFNDVYRSFSFFRGWAPFCATFFLAFGFYADTLFTFIFGSILFTVGGFDMSLWYLVAGIGFFLSTACVWFLKLAKNAVEANRRKFLFLRYVSENMRILAFNFCYGIPFEMRYINMDITSAQDPNRRIAAKILRRVLRRKTPVNININEKNINIISAHLNDYITEQDSYQSGRIIRFTQINNVLANSLKRFFILQMGILALRGVFQLFIGVTRANIEDPLNVIGFFMSLANCLALIIPAVYDLKERIKTGCRFEENYRIADNIIPQIKSLEKKIHIINEKKNISYEGMTVLTADIIEKLTSEQREWHNSIK
jgi:hypothetical protein